MTRYATLDPGFKNTRESKFLIILIEAIEAGDQSAFTAAVGEYNQVSDLDNWKTTILLKIKRSITEEPTLL
jgi:alpha-soluble NSF attachment protein